MAILTSLYPVLRPAVLFGAAPFSFADDGIHLRNWYMWTCFLLNMALRVLSIVKKRENTFSMSMATNISHELDTWLYDICYFGCYLLLIKNVSRIKNVFCKLNSLTYSNLLTERDLRNILWLSLLLSVFYNFLNALCCLSALSHMSLSLDNWENIVASAHDFIYVLLPLHLELLFIILAAVLSMLHDRGNQLMVSQLALDKMKSFVCGKSMSEQLDLLLWDGCVTVDQVRKLKSFRRYFFALSNLSASLSATFSGINVLCISFGFIDMLYGVYYCYEAQVGFSFCCWMTYIVVKLLAQVIACSRVVEKVSQLSVKSLNAFYC